MHCGANPSPPHMSDGGVSVAVKGLHQVPAHTVSEQRVTRQRLDFLFQFESV